ncbi:phosphatidylserine decarboxylase family protein [Weeksellaceae bacterium KMM 9713]|uniref:Phosphatidylserine decarboxylase family protein n=1 Tax=Profundicola chukchiensis TaxID=2961959 RepID=A0A9X4RW41_9FLAO|nr:phosphatidylserine decarboxylase family protein [Profundicola chukchiensis]MDG4946545.1 phosphatidylserine decarboxylase family protein [Profundicola chukchiensis]
MKLHKEGTWILIIGFVLLIAASIPLYLNGSTLSYIAIAALTIFFGFVVWFFRNPLREAKSEALEIVAPVDGKVVVIEKVFEKEYLKKEVMQVSIFMSPLNVHVCRYPVAGEVTYTKYHPGKYLVAFHPKSSELNERTTTVVKAVNGTEVLFRQIAGALARRIVLYAKPGDKAVAGTEYGFIKFGSRLDVFLPLDAEILCKLGDKTKGAVDIIAKLKE